MVHVVRGAIKNYDWGVTDGLAQWAGVRDGQPQAELWYGVHPSGPSDLLDERGARTGEILADHFDIDEIPLLVKILAADRPLSLQVHPDAQNARSAWDAGERQLYADPFAKTEMIVALSEFEALAGWRNHTVAAKILAGVGLPANIVASLEAGDRHACLRALVKLDTTAVETACAKIEQAAQDAGVNPVAAAALGKIAQQYPRDPGAIAAALLHHVHLRPGDALYVPCGVPHSYIHGLGFEVMTSSDNVLRLGLTSKTVAIEYALDALNDHLDASVQRAMPGDALSPADCPFTVRLSNEGKDVLETGAYRIVVSIDGSALVETDVVDVTLKPGTAAVLTASDPNATVNASGLTACVRWGRG